MRRFQLPLLGSNQDSPDPEAPLQSLEFRQLADLCASSCHPLPSSPAFKPDFAVPNSLKCRSLPKSIDAFLPAACLASGL